MVALSEPLVPIKEIHDQHVRGLLFNCPLSLSKGNRSCSVAIRTKGSFSIDTQAKISYIPSPKKACIASRKKGLEYVLKRNFKIFHSTGHHGSDAIQKVS
jgi:hypothetical protein